MSAFGDKAELDASHAAGAESDEGLINGRLSPALKSGAPEQPN